jgi:hypothetical protein
MVSRPGGFHPRPLSERCMNLSTHTAPVKQTCQPSLAASAQTDAGVVSRLLAIRATGSRSFAREPGSESCLLYTGRRLPSCQVSDRLVPGGNEAPGFDEQFSALQCFNGGSLAFVSPDPQLLRVRPRRFDSNAHCGQLLTAAAWSGLKLAPGSRLRSACLHVPCSLCTIGQLILEPPFRVPAAHSPPDTI